MEMKKQFKIAGITALALIGLVGCSEEVTKKEVVNVTATDKAKEEAPKAPEEPKKAPFEPQTIVDDENFKIILTGIETVEETEMETTRHDITYEIENKTDLLVEAQYATVSIDGKMVDDGMLNMSQEIAAGKKADAVLNIENWDHPEKLPELKGDLEMTINIFDWDYTLEKEYKVNVDLEK
jgi:hypothetical protein